MSGFTVLDRIASSVAIRLSERKALIPEGKLRPIAEASRVPFSFEKLFRLPGVHVIAEVKFASPSQGAIAYSEALVPETVAGEYLKQGAAALSILTEQDYFYGKLEYLRRIREAFPNAHLLMKDFILEEYQLLEARALGADAILLIVALLGARKTEELLKVARDLGLSALVEVHDEDELKMAIHAGATLIGVNNRNLKTLEIHLDTSFRLAPLVPKTVCLISESGLEKGEQIKELRSQGYSGFLIGTSLMKTGSPGKALAQLLAEAQ